MMHSSLTSTLDSINFIRRIVIGISIGIRFTHTLLLAGIGFGIWSLISHDNSNASQLTIAVLLALFGAIFDLSKGQTKIEVAHLLTALEMEYHTTKFTPFKLKGKHQEEKLLEEWRPLLKMQIREYLALSSKKVLRDIATLPILVLFFAVILYSAEPNFDTVISQVSKVVAKFYKTTATLEVLSGNPENKKLEPYPLKADRTVKLELLHQNMIEIKVIDLENGEIPRVDLYEIPSESKETLGTPQLLQSFKLSKIYNGAINEDRETYKLAFTLKNDANIYLTTISEETPVAEVKVRSLPNPKVTLNVTSILTDPWPDDKVLPLKINVTAKNPLATVKLVIRTHGQVYNELVNNILAPSIKEVSSDYELVLENYVQNDFSKVEIVAQAVDRAIPTPLMGFSDPLVLNTVSAYGRYLRTLESLRGIKGHLDEAIKSKIDKLDKSVLELSDQIIERAHESPFFDALDRLHISRFAHDIKELYSQPNMEGILNYLELLNNFLFEHEVINDRQRDRDFFVAIRALTRLIEQDPKSRRIAIETVIGRINHFLETRHLRWNMRVGRLPLSFKPKLWSQIKKMPFTSAMNQIEELDREHTQQNMSIAFKILSNTASFYKKWIDALESKEDEYRKFQEKSRQQSLASAQNILRQLQKRQDGISKNLDKASIRPLKDLNSIWPANRMDQNSNIKASIKLSRKLKSLSDLASKRINAAVESMKMTVKNGNDADFVAAESASDLAGRLLRLAERAAYKSQRQSRLRRRRHKTGDNYFGSRIVGGDIEIRHEYKVDRRYREDILDDVRRTKIDRGSMEKSLLEDYLRKVIR